MIGFDKAEYQVVGVCAPRDKTQPMDEFFAFLREKGHLVEVSSVSFRVAPLSGPLQEMAVTLTQLAKEFDQREGTLIENTISIVWEFRECCTRLGCPEEGPADPDGFAITEWAPTNEWNQRFSLGRHRTLSRVFTLVDPRVGTPYFGLKEGGLC